MNIKVYLMNKFGMIARVSPQLIEDIKNKYPSSVVEKCSSKSME